MWPPPAPPFHQISLPVSPVPPRKLQVVRFWTQTLSAFHASIPSRPAVPPLSLGPKFWADFLLLQTGVPGLVPSTITVLRFIPRTETSGFVSSTPAGTSGLPLGAL